LGDNFWGYSLVLDVRRKILSVLEKVVDGVLLIGTDLYVEVHAEVPRDVVLRDSDKVAGVSV